MREVNGAVPFYPAKPKERQANSKYRENAIVLRKSVRLHQKAKKINLCNPCYAEVVFFMVCVL